MVAKLAGKLSDQRRNRILLEVRETNLPAQLFFRENGFRAVSVSSRFYEDTPEDAYLHAIPPSAIGRAGYYSVQPHRTSGRLKRPICAKLASVTTLFCLLDSPRKRSALLS